MATPTTPSPTTAGKAPWKSKTLWAGVLTAALPLIPGIGPVISGYVASNPEAATAIVGLIFAGLRLATNNKIDLPQ